MNDRFRFRAWDTDVNEMYHDINSYDMAEMLADSELIPMQCTGLKDKNGKLIFERDVAKALSKPDREGCFSEWLGEIVYNTENCQFQFKVEKYKFMGEGSLNTYPCHYYIDFIEIDNIEIIGNIYENKDLLKCENQ